MDGEFALEAYSLLSFLFARCPPCCVDGAGIPSRLGWLFSRQSVRGRGGYVAFAGRVGTVVVVVL